MQPDLTACLDYPELGKSAGELFFVEGWAFSRTSGIRNVFLRHPSGTTFPLERMQRSDVGSAFPDVPGAAQSGFSSVEPIRCRLAAGIMEVVIVFDDGSEQVAFCFPFTGPAPKRDDFSVSADFLRARRESARSSGGLCVLFIDDRCVPDAADGRRQAELLRAMVEQGHAVSLLLLREPPAAIDRGALPASVEVLSGHGTAAVIGHVAARPGFFDRTVVCRPSNLRRLLKHLDQLPRPLIYDAAGFRSRMDALPGELELDLASRADVVLANSAVEQGVFERGGCPSVIVVPDAIDTANGVTHIRNEYSHERLREALGAALGMASAPARARRESTRRRVFIDCGTHYGEGLRELAGKVGIDASWEVHCFEANPACWWYYDRERLLEIPCLTIHRQAVWIEDGFIDVRQEDHVASGSRSPRFGGPDVDGWGSTIVAESTHPGLQSPVQVPSIDLSRFVRDTAMGASEIILKLDVEGAEYAILRKMIAEGALDYLDRLYVEFHSRLLPSESMESTLALRAEIQRRFPQLSVEGWG